MSPKGQTLINLRFATVPSLLLWLRIFRPNFPNMSFQKFVSKTLLYVVNMRVYLQPTALTMRIVPENDEKSLFFKSSKPHPLCRAMIKSEDFQMNFCFCISNQNVLYIHISGPSVGSEFV